MVEDSAGRRESLGARLGRAAGYFFTLLALVCGLIGPVLVVPSASAGTIPPSSTGQTFPARSLIIDLGKVTGTATQQTTTQALKPYGLVFQFLVTRKIPVYWAIANGKAAGNPPSTGKVDPIDFTVPSIFPNGVGAPAPVGSGTGPTASKSYKSSAFIVSWDDLKGEDATALSSLLATWRGGTNLVTVDVAAADFSAPKFARLTSWPKAVLDMANGNIAVPFYTNAGIPATQQPAVPAGAPVFNTYVFKTPAQLTPCDDIYVMPHADPTWATHNNLINFNNSGGFIWAGCHAVSVMENITNPNSPSVAPAMNFLSTTGLVPFGSHSNGTPPYAYTPNGSDPIMQFLGVMDSATLNGSEQIYLPKPGGGWRATTNVLAFDPTDTDVPAKSPGPPAVMAYGRGFGKATNGLVMYQAGHNLNNGSVGSGAAQRAFLNFHLLAGIERAPTATTTVPATMTTGSANNISANVTGGTFSASTPGSYTWSASCAGTFGQASGSLTAQGTVSTTFTPSGANGNCNIKFILTDGCGRVTFGSSPTQVITPADVSITKVDQPDPVAAGSQLTYTITVTNGVSPGGSASNVAVQDTLPAGTALLSAAWQGSPPPGSTCSIAANTLNCTYGDLLAPGASATIRVTANVLSSATSPLQNTATVSALNDNNPANNSATASTTVVHPAINLHKTASPPGGVRGNQLIAQDDFDTPSPPCTPTSANCGTGWTTTWQEFGESNGWSSNDVRVVNPFPSGTTNTVLQVANNTGGVGKGAYRTLDLSTAAGVTNGVTISWDFARVLGNARSATVQLCTDATHTTCTVLATYNGSANDTTLSHASVQVSATGTVVPATRSFELRRTTSLEGGAAVIDERRVVNGTVYVRVIDQAGPGVSAPWDSSPVSAEPERDFDGVFTAEGTAMGHLVDLPALIRGAGFSATRLPGSLERYQLRAPAEKIAQYYIAQGTPLAQPLPPQSTSVVEFTVGSDHVLTDLSAYGTVFEDGEPLEPAVIDVHYHPVAPVLIAAPAPTELRH